MIIVDPDFGNASNIIAKIVTQKNPRVHITELCFGGPFPFNGAISLKGDSVPDGEYVEAHVKILISTANNKEEMKNDKD